VVIGVSGVADIRAFLQNNGGSLEQEIDDTEVECLARLWSLLASCISVVIMTLTRLAVLSVVELCLLSDGSGNEVLGVLRVEAPVVASLELHVALSLGTKLLLLVAKRLAHLSSGAGLGSAGAGGSSYLRRGGISSCAISGLVDGDGFAADIGWRIGGLQSDGAARSLAGASAGGKLDRGGIRAGVVAIVVVGGCESSCDACESHSSTDETHD